jgi:hypothetical protein
MVTKQEIINEVLQEWADGFLRELEQSAAGKLRQDTGAGQGSFDTNMIKAKLTDGANVTAMVMVGFNNYMRYFDMSNRNLRRDKDLPPEGIERMKDWVRRNLDKLLPAYKGPTTYKYKPGTVPEKTIINNIAWGISKKRKRLKRHQWYAKLKASEQYKLYYRLLDELLPVMLAEVKGKIIING